MICGLLYLEGGGLSRAVVLDLELGDGGFRGAGEFDVSVVVDLLDVDFVCLYFGDDRLGPLFDVNRESRGGT